MLAVIELVQIYSAASDLATKQPLFCIFCAVQGCKMVEIFLPMCSVLERESDSLVVVVVHVGIEDITDYNNWSRLYLKENLVLSGPME